MNFVEFVKAKGRCKTAAGHKIHDIRATGWDKNYPIIGRIEWANGHLTDMCWDKEGMPHNLPMNHGLHLVGLVPRIEFDVVDVKELKELNIPESIQNAVEKTEKQKKQGKNYA